MINDFKIISLIDDNLFNYFNNYNFVFLKQEDISDKIILKNYYYYLSKYEKKLAVIITNCGCYLISKQILKIKNIDKKNKNIISLIYNSSINSGIISINNEIINNSI